MIVACLFAVFFIAFRLSGSFEATIITLVFGLCFGILWATTSIKTNTLLEAIEKIQAEDQKIDREAKKEIIRKLENRIQKERKITYNQLEAMQSVYFEVKPSVPLPTMGGWAVSPDTALILIDLIKRYQPKTVVDIGSGTSSIIAGYLLKDRAKDGVKVFSVDHSDEFAVKTRNQVKDHKLDQIVSVYTAPLVDQKIKKQSYSWYDLKDVNLGKKKIDLLFVDGPPGATQQQSRYPALPILRDKMSDTAVIVVDDFDREDEKAMVDRWMKDNKEYSLETFRTEKGVAVLYRNKVGEQK